MIFDTSSNAALYAPLHKQFAKAFAFIAKAQAETLPVGKYELDGSDLYASVQEYTTRSPWECRFEAHRNYIDIQYILSGMEAFEVTDRSKVTTETPYNDEKDVEFFSGAEIPVKAVLGAGEYGIFFPNDIHRPGLSHSGKPVPVRKIVVKVRI